MFDPTIRELNFLDVLHSRLIIIVRAIVLDKEEIEFFKRPLEIRLVYFSCLLRQYIIYPDLNNLGF